MVKVFKVQIFSCIMAIMTLTVMFLEVLLSSPIMVIYDKYGKAFKSPDIKSNYSKLRQVR